MYLTVLLIMLMPLSAESKDAVESESDRDHYRSFEKKLDFGIAAFYRTDWDEARSIFDDLQKADENDPRPYFFEAMVPFWKYFFADESPAAAQEFLEKSEKAIQVGKRRMKAAPEDTTTVLMMGGLFGYRGLVAASERHYRTAVQSGASGLSFTRRLMSMSTDNPDVLIGQGVFNYMMGTIPREARWLTSMIGLSGNRNEGLRMLEEAAMSDSYTSADAGMILAYLYHEEERYDDALRIVEPLVQNWPDNIIFRYYYAMALEKTEKKNQAKKQYQIIIDNKHAELGVIRKKGEKGLQRIMASEDP